jgi:hypothetical protein
VTISGLGSGRSNTCRPTWPVAITSVNGSPQAAEASAKWVDSGIEVLNLEKRLARVAFLTVGLLP